MVVFIGGGRVVVTPFGQEVVVGLGFLVVEHVVGFCFLVVEQVVVVGFGVVGIVTTSVSSSHSSTGIVGVTTNGVVVESELGV